MNRPSPRSSASSSSRRTGRPSQVAVLAATPTRYSYRASSAAAPPLARATAAPASQATASASGTPAPRRLDQQRGRERVTCSGCIDVRVGRRRPRVVDLAIPGGNGAVRAERDAREPASVSQLPDRLLGTGARDLPGRGLVCKHHRYPVRNRRQPGCVERHPPRLRLSERGCDCRLGEMTGDQYDLRLEHRQVLRLVAAVCAAVGADPHRRR